MPSRRRSRERALQVLFNWDLRQGDVWRAVDDFYETLHSEDDQPPRLERDQFMEELVRGTVDRIAEIDPLIGRHAAHWRLERMPGVDRNVLRLATFEMMQGELPHAVVIDEALEMVKRYSGEESVAFVNGVLDAVHRALGSASSSPINRDLP